MTLGSQPSVVPASVISGWRRAGSSRGSGSNTISEREPAQRLAQVREQTAALQQAQPALAARTLFSVAEWTGSQLLSVGARTLATEAPADLVAAAAVAAESADEREELDLAALGVHGPVSVETHRGLSGVPTSPRAPPRG